MSRSPIEKCISKAIWETLSKVRHADEKLAWDGEKSEDIFFTPPQSLVKGNVGCNVVSSTQSHLSGVIHYTFVEELTNLELAYLGSHACEYSRPKQKQQQGFKFVIKLGVRQPQPTPPSFNGSQGNKQVESSGI
jgi:hypothetical protein